MDSADLQSDWALIAGGSLVILIAVYVLSIVYQRSAVGQLRRSRATLANAIRERQKALLNTEKRRSRLDKLVQRSDSTKPRLLQEAKEFFEDAKALEKIATDKVLIAENHVRKVIHGEFSPNKHDHMRRKYLPLDKSDGKPFSF